MLPSFDLKIRVAKATFSFDESVHVLASSHSFTAAAAVYCLSSFR